MRLWATLAGVAMVFACSGPGGTAAAPSPAISASPSATLSAVPSAKPSAQAASPTTSVTWPTLAVYDSPASSPTLHMVTLVAIADVGRGEVAKMIASAPAAYRSWRPGPDVLGPIDLPYVSTSSSRAYFLDGDSNLRSLSPTDAAAPVATLPGDYLNRVAFAVSPDDKQIAVAVINYSQQIPSLRLYVESLGGGPQVQVFASSKLYYWPVGWHGGRIVLASGPALVRNYLPLNQYSASRYFLIDPAPGSKPVEVGTGDCAPTGAINSEGTACVSNPGGSCMGSFVSTYGGTDWYASCLRKVDWSGVETDFLMARYYQTALVVKQAALSPDGGVILTDGYFLIKAPVSGHGDWQNQLGMPPPAAPEQPGMGWIDPFHFSMIYIQSNGTGFQRILWFNEGRESPGNVVFDGFPVVNGVATSPIAGQFVGTVPGGL